MWAVGSSGAGSHRAEPPEARVGSGAMSSLRSLFPPTAVWNTSWGWVPGRRLHRLTERFPVYLEGTWKGSHVHDIFSHVHDIFSSWSYSTSSRASSRTTSRVSASSHSTAHYSSRARASSSHSSHSIQELKQAYMSAIIPEPGSAQATAVIQAQELEQAPT